MKYCPICNRTYQDDTLVFCLDDGTRLSAANDPHATVPASAVAGSDPPETAILPPGLTPAPLRPTVKAVAPDAYPQRAQGNDSTEKPGGKRWIILGLSGIVALLAIGLISALGYLAFQARNESVAEPSVSGSNAPTISNVPEVPVSNSNTLTNSNVPDPSVSSFNAPTNNNLPSNDNEAIESKLTEENSSFNWLDGVWTGEGYQTDTKTTWAVVLTAENGTYTIEYPNIPCRGRWNLNSKNSRGASFTEVITQGADRCSNNGHILLEKMNDSEISCKYSHAGSRVVIATAVLSKK